MHHAYMMTLVASYLCTVSLRDDVVNWCVAKAITKLLVKVKAMLQQELSRGRIDGVRVLTQHPDVKCLHFTTVSTTGLRRQWLPLETSHAHGEDPIHGCNVTL